MKIDLKTVIYRIVVNARGKAVQGSRVLLVGVSYKKDVGDIRESPALKVMARLRRKGAHLSYHDPYVPVIKPTREHPDLAGRESVTWNRSNIASFDLVLIATNHACVNYQELADWAQCIVDTRNAMAAVKVAPGKVWKA